jgi:hypothetical protein
VNSNENRNENETEYELFVRVPRGIEPVVPRDWLLNCYVFEWPRDVDPLYCLPEGDTSLKLRARFERNQTQEATMI